jgi:hypothetical protein
MRIGSDLMIFTKKDNVLSILLISQSFQTKETMKNGIICLMPSFNNQTKMPYHDDGEGFINQKRVSNRLVLFLFKNF